MSPLHTIRALIRAKASDLIEPFFWGLSCWALYICGTVAAVWALQGSMYTDPYFGDLFRYQFLLLEAICSFVPFCMLGLLGYFGFSAGINCGGAWSRVFRGGFYLALLLIVLIVFSQWSHLLYAQRFYSAGLWDEPFRFGGGDSKLHIILSLLRFNWTVGD